MDGESAFVPLVLWFTVLLTSMGGYVESMLDMVSPLGIGQISFMAVFCVFTLVGGIYLALKRAVRGSRRRRRRRRMVLLPFQGLKPSSMEEMRVLELSHGADYGFMIPVLVRQEIEDWYV